MSKPFINDALVGNGRLLAAFSAHGELVRCWWPSVDFGQHVNRLRIGLATNDQTPISWLDGDPGCDLRYEGNSNILCLNHQAGHLAVQRTVFAVPNLDVLIHHIHVKEGRHADGSGVPQIVVFADLHLNEQPRYQATRFESEHGAIVHYFRDVYVAVGFLEGRPDKYRAAALAEDASIAALDGAGGGLGSQSSMAKRASTVGRDEEFEGTICIAFGHTLAQSLDALNQARHDGFLALLTAAREDAHRFLSKTVRWPSGLSDALASLSSRKADVQSTAFSIDDFSSTIYTRSLLTFRLLQGDSGAMIAAPEFDETFSRCGGYAYCWGRDAAFIVSAMEEAGMLDEAARFYVFALTAQGEDGLWEHRHYVDGQLAPSWGIQLDETASLLWGMARHCLRGSDLPLRQVFSAMQKAALRLMDVIDPDTHLLLPSVDLWEERRAEHLYSTAAASAALRAFTNLCRDETAREGIVSLGVPSLDDVALRDLATHCEEGADALADGIRRATSTQHGGFLRARWLSVDEEAARRLARQSDGVRTIVDDYGYSIHAVSEDHIIDVSLLGLCVPFDVISANDERMQTTARLVEERLTRKVGGIGRYEDDPYIGGNPWILATLWLALYKLRIGDSQGALEHVLWTVEHATSLGYLPEQVDKSSGNVAWVNPLAWSHAMYVWFACEWAESQRFGRTSGTALHSTQFGEHKGDCYGCECKPTERN